MKTMENQKKRKCNERILYGKNGSLTPLVFITNGGWAPKQNNFIDDSVNCYVKNQMLATVVLVRGLNGKYVLVSFKHPSFA